MKVPKKSGFYWAHRHYTGSVPWALGSDVWEPVFIEKNGWIWTLSGLVKLLPSELGIFEFGSEIEHKL